ncbi:MAG: glycosyltransferase [Desulfobacterales bacterium]
MKRECIFVGRQMIFLQNLVKSHIQGHRLFERGCPTCVLEAMATGVPSIGFADCPGTNELIQHGENGILVSPEDRVGNLSQALHQLMASAEKRLNMGKRAWRDGRQFDPDTIYDQWEQLFYEMAEYKDDPERLFREQMAVDPEKAMHARRMRVKLIKQLETN